MLSPKIDKSFKVAIIADLHSCYYGENQNELIRAIDSNQPDLVFFIGDILDEKMPDDNAYITLKRLTRKYPAFYVFGNHEFYTGKIDQIKQMVGDLGVKILAGEQAEIVIKENRLIIKGLSDPEIGAEEYNRQLEAIKVSFTNNFTFLLAHRPERIDDYNKIRHDLVLSGHAHGGHWRIPKILPGIYAPHQGLFPRYTSGFYQLKRSKLLVSRGLSRENIKIPRFYNSPEVIILELAKS